AVPQPNVAPNAVASVSCTGLTCLADGTASSDPDGTVVGHSWDFGDGSDPVEGATATHTFDEEGTYTVTLTVTDDEGATDTDTATVTVAEPVTDVTFVGATSSNANASSHTVAVPPGVEAGDTLLLFATANIATPGFGTPSGG